MTADVTRYLCPLPACDWHYDAPEPGVSDLEGTRPAPHVLGLADILSSVVEQALQRRMAAVEAVVGQHFEGHDLEDWLTEIARLQGLLRCHGIDPATEDDVQTRSTT